MVTINIKKKDLYLICAILVFFVAVGFVIAYGGNNPSVMGHSAAEVSGTVVGSCVQVCSLSQGVFYACGATWGAGVCSATGAVCSPNLALSTACSCSSGTRTFAGVFHAYSTSDQTNSMAQFFLCVTP